MTLSTNTPLEELLRNRRAKAALVKIMPQITSIPASMQKMSMRDLAARMGNTEQTEMFDRIDEILAKI